MIKPSVINRVEIAVEASVRVAVAPSKGIVRIQQANVSVEAVAFPIYAEIKAYSNAMLPTPWTLVGGTTYKSIMPECQLVFYNGTKLTENPGGFGALGANEWDWDTDSLYINIGVNPTGQIIEAAFIDLAHEIGMANSVKLSATAQTKNDLDWTYFDSGLVVVATTTANAPNWIVEIMPDVESVRG